ncbi:MAG: hypothetical protein J0J04_04755 [Microbacterium sp.]|uniref:hypothetical protein n=1 Tax=Microbacterium sp. TaxID=51671 RepID=UPI001AC06D56|nr:hypothetical protein [Microbacterium sp.]MBN9214118.1 hypothetical protein [Microbacterium sp.]
MTAAVSASKRVMRDSVRQHFPTGRTLATMLTHVSRGMSADGLLAVGAGDLDEAGIIQLPQFAIRDFEGSDSVNRIQWEGESGRTVRVIAYGTTTELPWKVQDSSLPELNGTLVVTFDDNGTVIDGDMPPMIGADVAGNLTAMLGADVAGRSRMGVTNGNPLAPTVTHVFSAAEAERRLRRISEHGTAQMFALSGLLTPYAREAVNRASTRVYREIHGLDVETSAAEHIIDEIERDSVLDELMLGTRQTDSVVIRLIRRVAATDATVCKSVMQFIATAIWSGAETQVRHHIGDPHLGRVIRRLARSLGTLTGNVEDDANNVLQAYRSEFPEQRLGIGRVIDALTAGATVHSQTVAFDIDADGPTKAEKA